jgi:hypothetical protein
VQEKLKKDFGYPLATIQPVVLVFKNSPQHKQYIESKSIQRLADELKIRILLTDIKIILP